MVSRVVEGRNIVDLPTGKVMYLIKTRGKKRDRKKNATIAVNDLICHLEKRLSRTKKRYEKDRRQKIESATFTLILRVKWHFSPPLSLSFSLFRILAHLTALYCRLIFFQPVRHEREEKDRIVTRLNMHGK